MKTIVQFYKDMRGEYRYRIKASNGKIIADSAEGYKRVPAALNAFNALRARMQYAHSVIFKRVEK